MPDEDTEEESCSDDLGDGDDLDMIATQVLEGSRDAVECRTLDERGHDFAPGNQGSAARHADSQAVALLADRDGHFGLRRFAKYGAEGFE